MSWLSESLGGGGGGEADQARRDEEARQARIRAGTKRINELFTGGVKTGTNRIAGGAYNPLQKYYTASGAVWTPKTGNAPTTTTMRREPREVNTRGGGTRTAYSNVPVVTGGGAYANPAAQFAEAQKAGLYGGSTTSTGAFGGDFFANRRKSYLDFAAPQVADQYGKAGEELTFALARSGLLESSSRASKAAELKKLYDINKQKVADEALSYETQARTSVEDAKQNLIQMLNTTGDVQGTVNSAISRASALSKPPAYSPISQLFADFTNALGAQAAQERSFAAGGPTPRYNTGLFSPNRNSVAYG